MLRGFLEPDERRAAFEAAVGLSGQAEAAAAASIDRPDSVSTAHNVNSEERFKSLALPLGDGRTAVCEHFSSYADGHRLTYYRAELPTLGVPSLVARLEAIRAIQDEVAVHRSRLGKPDGPMRWRLTLNHYPPAFGLGNTRLGFPWHRDLVANGAATMILNLGAPGAIEFGEEPPPPDGEAGVDGLRYSNHNAAYGEAVEAVSALEAVTLTDGDLLLLTGPARWEYLHRVAPTAGGGERVSLVYGVW